MSVHPPPTASVPFAVSDLRRIVDLEEPAITPNGKRVAVIALRADQSSLWVIDVATGRSREIAKGGSVSVPRWSHDGRVLAFLQQNGSGALQLHTWSGGVTRQAGSFPGGVVDFAWSPDDSQFVLGATDEPRSAPYFLAGDNDYTLGAIPPSEHLWLLSRSGAVHRLTHGSWTVAPTDPGGVFTSQFAWSRDATQIVFTRLPNTFSGDNEYSSLWRVNVRTGILKKLTVHRAFELSALPSPDGARWVYSYPRGGNYLANNTIVPLGNAGRSITVNLDLNAGGALWMPDGKSLVICADRETRVGAWEFELNGRFSALPLGGLNISCDSYQDSEFDSGLGAAVSKSGALAFVGSDSKHPRELYYLRSLFAAPVRLTHFNDALSGIALGAQRQISWRSTDGFTEYGVVTFPPGMKTGRKYPIVVDIHGGPGQASIQDFAPAPQWPRPQLIAARGYVVFEPNYRGSDDAGNAFLLAIAGDPVRGPASDILSGLAAVEHLPQADPTRIGVCGWSYGGQLTSWLITQDHRWRAAVSGAAVDNEIEEYAFSESNVQDRYYQKTSPFAPGGDAVYRNNTPITFSSTVTTPTLIWSTAGDPVVPITQSYEFYRALKERGVPVRFAVFPGGTHGPGNEQQRETLTTLWLDWLDKYMRRP